MTRILRENQQHDQCFAGSHLQEIAPLRNFFVGLHKSGVYVIITVGDSLALPECSEPMGDLSTVVQSGVSNGSGINSDLTQLCEHYIWWGSKGYSQKAPYRKMLPAAK